MRTTLDIDADVLEIAKERAKGSKVSVGKALSDLARRGMQSRIQLFEKNGVYVIPASVGGGAFGPEDVKAALDSEFDDYQRYFRKAGPE